MLTINKKTMEISQIKKSKLVSLKDDLCRMRAEMLSQSKPIVKPAGKNKRTFMEKLKKIKANKRKALITDYFAHAKTPASTISVCHTDDTKITLAMFGTGTDMEEASTECAKQLH